MVLSQEKAERVKKKELNKVSPGSYWNIVQYENTIWKKWSKNRLFNNGVQLKNIKFLS